MKRLFIIAFALVLTTVFGFAQHSEAKEYENTAKPESTVPWEYSTLNPMQIQSGSAVIADISKWQGTVDWAKASKALDLVIIRTQDGVNNEDNMHRANETGAYKYNVPFGVYSFVRAGTPAEARKEAQKFYNRASKNTQFYVLDVEVKTNKSGYSMRQVINAYTAEMRKLTNKKVGLYVANHLYSSFNLDVSKFNFVWIPRYSSSAPTHAHDLWQYTSSGSVPGIKGNVDLNRLAGGTKLEFFTNKVLTISNEKLSKKYYVTNPKYVIVKSKVNGYSKKDFKKKNIKKKYAAGSMLKVKKITKSSAGIPHLELENGYYITASKSYVLKTSAATVEKYYDATDKVTQIMTLKTLKKYKSASSTSNGVQVPKYTIFNVTKIAYSGSGQNRFKLRSGEFISASKNDVVEVPDTITNYYRDKRTDLQTQKAVYSYDNLLFGETEDKILLPIGTNIKVIDVVYNRLGFPRYQLEDGRYISTKKTLFKDLRWYEQD